MKKFFTLSCLSILIVACTQNTPAEVSDISDLSSNDRSQGYEKPPTNISTGGSISSSPQYNNYSQPVYAPSVTTTNIASSNTTSSTVTTEISSTVEGNSSRIVYNRNYDSIPKGGYKGDLYTVKRGDTLYYIAWITGNDVRTLAVKNNLREPYSINVGQVLDVTGGNTSITPQATPSSYRSSAVVTTTISTPNQVVPTKQTAVIQPIPNSNVGVSTPVRVDTVRVDNSAATSIRSNISWQWPAKGKIIEKFSNSTKGIDIAGSLGNKVVAAANGRVVYSGNDLPGYGNLIIIKHNDDYLTAYAHNQSVLIKEQQMVKAGQQIATMGATGTSSIRLHFEIRYKGKSVDPQKYLP